MGKNVYRPMSEVRKDCELKAQSLAGPIQVSEAVAGRASFSDEQFVSVGDMSEREASCAPVAAHASNVEQGLQAARDADVQSQSHTAPPLPKATSCFAGSSELLSVDFAGLTGRRGKVLLQQKLPFCTFGSINR